MMSQDVDVSRLKKSRNIELLVGILVGVSAIFRWTGVYGEGPISPWLTTVAACACLASAGYKTYRLRSQ